MRSMVVLVVAVTCIAASGVLAGPAKVSKQADGVISADSSGVISPEQRITIIENYRMATVRVASSLSRYDLGRLGSGYVLPFDTLNENERQECRKATELMLGPLGYRKMIREAPVGSIMSVCIPPEFTLILSGPALGETEERIPLDEPFPELSPRTGVYVAALPGDWRPQESLLVTRDQWMAMADSDTYARKRPPAEFAVSPVQNPPSLAQLLAKAPRDPEARIDWLRQTGIDLLSPIGKARLSKAVGLPFSYQDFARGATYEVHSLNDRQSAWLKEVYEQHRQRVERQQELLKRYRDHMTRTGQGIDSERTLIFVPDTDEPAVVVGPSMPAYQAREWESHGPASSAAAVLRRKERSVGQDAVSNRGF